MPDRMREPKTRAELQAALDVAECDLLDAETCRDEALAELEAFDREEGADA